MDIKKKRIKIACDACNKKRTKCDGQVPCSECLKNNIPCTISRKVGKRGPKAGYLEALENRIRVLESVLTPEQWNIVGQMEDFKAERFEEVMVPSHSNTLSLVAAGGIPQEHLKRLFKDNTSFGLDPSLSNPPFFGDLSHLTKHQTQTPTNSNATRPTPLIEAAFFTSHAQAQSQPGRLPQTAQPTPNLHQQPNPTPNPSIIETDLVLFELINSYFLNVHHKIPFLHELSFMQSVGSQKKSLLNAMYALASVFRNTPSESNISMNKKPSRYQDGDLFYHRAIELVSQEPPSELDHYSVATLFLLFKYAKGSGRISQGITFYLDAFEKITQLELNKDMVFYKKSGQFIPISETVRELRRRLFWTFYEYDVYVSFILGESPLMKDMDIFVALPVDDEAWNMMYSLEKRYGPDHFCKGLKEEPPLRPSPLVFPFTETSETTFATFCSVSLIQLCHIFSKICKLNLENSVSERVSGDYNQRFSMIENSLSAWYKSFDSWLANNLVFSGAGIGSHGTPPWMTTFIQTFYYFCIIALHRPRILRDSRPHTPQLCMHPSFIAAHDASSSISSIVLQMHNNNTTSDFKFVPSFLHTILFHLGLSYALFATLLPYSESRQLYIQHIDVFIIALDRLSVYFSPIQNKVDVLRQLKASLNNPNNGRMNGNYEAEITLFKKACSIGYPSLTPYVPTDIVQEYSTGREKYHSTTPS